MTRYKHKLSREVATGEMDLVIMWYLPICNGRICRNEACDNGHYGYYGYGESAVPVFHGGSR